MTGVVGVLAFTKGLEATLWRHAVWNGGYFGVIFGVRQALPESKVPCPYQTRAYVPSTIHGKYQRV